MAKRYEAQQLSNYIYTIFTKGVLGKPSNLTMGGGGGGGSNFFIALFHVLGHCSYEYDFLIIFLFFLFFPEKVQESRGGEHGK